MKKTSLKSCFLLLLAAFIWGIAFVAQSVGMDYMGPLTFNGVRFLMGSAVLMPIVWVKRRNGHKKKLAMPALKPTLTGGICCGMALCCAALLQQYGIIYTTVGKAGFITTLYIILVPIFGVFLKRRIPGRVWIAAMIAAAGMYLLCMSERLKLGRGDILVFFCAIVFSIHILVVDHFAEMTDGVELSFVQFLTAGVIGTVLSLFLEHPHISDLLAGIIPLAYAGILSSGVAYTLQIVGQKNADPTIASLLMSMESVFSVLAGWLLLQQKLSVRELSGCCLVFAAVILVQLPERKKQEKDMYKA